jgi:hypothetical protein
MSSELLTDEFGLHVLGGELNEKADLKKWLK